MKIRVLLIFLTIIILVSTGCTAPSTPTLAPTLAPTSAATPTQKVVRIALFISVLDNSYNQSIISGAKDSASKYGATVDVYNNDFDTNKEISQLQDAIASGKFDAFIMNPNDGMAVVPEVEEAAKAGIPIGTWDGLVGPNSDTLVPYPGVNVVASTTGKIQGKYFGEKIVEVCGNLNPCKVFYMIGIQSITMDQDRVAGMHAVLAQYPNIQIVAEQEASYAQDKGLSITQNILQAHPDINVIASAGDQMSLGAIKAVADAGLTDKVIVLGNGASKEGVQAVRDGTMYATYANIPFTAGQLVAEWIIRAARGEQVLKSFDMSTISPPLPASGPWITKDSANEFQAQW